MLSYGVIQTIASFLDCHVASASLTRSVMLSELGSRTQVKTAVGVFRLRFFQLLCLLIFLAGGMLSCSVYVL